MGHPVGTKARNGRQRWLPEMQDCGEMRPERQRHRDTHTETTWVPERQRETA